MIKGTDYIGVGAGALIFNEKGEVLLSKRGLKARNERGKWDFPGGGVRFGETLESAIKREMKEEFDINVEVDCLLEICDHIIPEEKQHWVSPTFICRLVSGEAKIMEPDKTEAIGWFTVDNIPKSLTIASGQNLKTYIEKFGNKAIF